MLLRLYPASMRLPGRRALIWVNGSVQQRAVSRRYDRMISLAHWGAVPDGNDALLDRYRGHAAGPGVNARPQFNEAGFEKSDEQR